MEYRSLEHESSPAILECYNGAFADYALPMTMTWESLDRMLTGRGYNPSISVGAYDGDKLVGIVFNALRDWRGTATAYDTGTGLLPQYRGKGVATAMVKCALELLRKAGAKQYLLEVLCENTSAVALYRRQGFRETRHFLCYRHENPDRLAPGPWEVKWQPVTPALVEQIGEMGELYPSWQNSGQSIFALPQRYACVTVEDGEGLLGCAVMEQTGGIAQLAVRRDVCRRGIGRSLLHAMASRATGDKLTLINVDETGRETVVFLESMGFHQFTSQYEMVMPL